MVLDMECMYCKQIVIDKMVDVGFDNPERAKIISCVPCISKAEADATKIEILLEKQHRNSSEEINNGVSEEEANELWRKAQNPSPKKIYNMLDLQNIFKRLEKK